MVIQFSMQSYSVSSITKVILLPYRSLTTLLLHSNQLSELPYNMNQLCHLSTLVIAFNKFFELPQVVKELPSLKILIASGNHIRYSIHCLSVHESCRDFYHKMNLYCQKYWWLYMYLVVGPKIAFATVKYFIIGLVVWVRDIHVRIIYAEFGSRLQ